MTNDIYTAVDDCKQCGKQNATTTHQRHLELFPRTGPMDFKAVDIL